GVVREATTHRQAVQHVPAGWLSDGRVIEITDDGSEHLYLAALDPRTGARERIDSPDWDVELAVSSADGAVQAWSVNDDGYSKLRWRREGPIREHDLAGVCGDLVVSADGGVVAYTRQAAREPWEIWTLDTRSGENRMVLTTTRAVPPDELVEPELIRIPAADGPIPCFVYWPRRTDGPVPAVLVPHGGPEGQSRPILTPDDMALVQRGVALVVPNIHGSTGYGRAWQVAIHKDWGGIDLRDLRAITDHVRRPDTVPAPRPAGRERPTRSQARVGSGRRATPRARTTSRVRRLSRRRPRLHEAGKPGRRARADPGVSDEGAARELGSARVRAGS